nr:type VI secretion system amidase immunity protein Tai4 [Achromobacter sp.]
MIALCLGTAHAEDTNSPQAYKRSYAQNYKDLVLATCLTTAYKGSDEVAKDVGSSISALRDWSYYDMEKHPDAISPLIHSYLSRNYFNPLVEAEVKGVRFDFLKCLDLYHSKELNSLTKELVSEPDRTIEQKNAGRRTKE